MSRYSVDAAAVAALMRAVSGSVGEVELDVTAAIAGVDAVDAALGSLARVRGAFADVAEGRRQTGPGLVAHARGVIGAAQQGTIAVIEGDEATASSTAAAEAASGQDWVAIGRGFGPVAQ